MVRFNDKKQATELSPEDILIMTDVSDSDSDKKVTMNQMANYVAGIVPSNLPSQAGHAGQYLKTDGTDATWADVQSLPLQTGQAGKYLKTDGTDATWADVPTNTGLELCDIGMALYVDETKGLRRYLNGQIVDINTNTQAFLNRLQEITTLHPSLLCTENEWQTAKTMSAFGQVGKFVFNYSGNEVVSVRLPRVVNVQGLFDLQNLGMTVDESLPNIKGTIDNTLTWVVPSASGAFVASRQTDQPAAGSASTTFAKFSFNASHSSSTYQDNAPVQQEAIQYPYFIQIATGSETENNIINEIELNNPYSLFDSKYSDHELNNLSWLKSEGQWNAKAVYTDAYDKLLKVYNGTETVAGISVKLSTETYTDYDFVLNTADETFRLPLKTKLASGKAIVGNGMAVGLTNGTVYAGLTNSTSNSIARLSPVPEGYGAELGGTPTGSNNLGTSYVGVTTDPTKSGIELSDSGLYLYFYVGETVQNANLIDAGRIGEQLAIKTDMLQASGAGMPSSKYIDLTLGESGSTYTAPANGWFYFYGKTSQANQWVSMFSDGKIAMTGNSAFSGFGVPCYVPVLKNDTMNIYYNIPWGSNSLFRFYYAQGSEGEV